MGKRGVAWDENEKEKDEKKWYHHISHHTKSSQNSRSSSTTRALQGRMDGWKWNGRWNEMEWRWWWRRIVDEMRMKMDKKLFHSLTNFIYSPYTYGPLWFWYERFFFPFPSSLNVVLTSQLHTKQQTSKRKLDQNPFQFFLWLNEEWGKNTSFIIISNIIPKRNCIFFR